MISIACYDQCTCFVTQVQQARERLERLPRKQQSASATSNPSSTGAVTVNVSAKNKQENAPIEQNKLLLNQYVGKIII